MTAVPSLASSTSSPAARDTLRFWGVLVLVFFVLTSAVGGSLAMESSYLIVTLASHIGLALVTLGLAAYATSFVGRTYPTLPRAASGLAALSALAATISGTIFLLGGQSDAALYAMESFAALGIVAGLLMTVFGGPTRRRAQTGPMT